MFMYRSGLQQCLSIASHDAPNSVLYQNICRRRRRPVCDLGSILVHQGRTMMVVCVYLQQLPVQSHNRRAQPHTPPPPRGSCI